MKSVVLRKIEELIFEKDSIDVTFNGIKAGKAIYQNGEIVLVVDEDSLLKKIIKKGANTTFSIDVHHEEI